MSLGDVRKQAGCTQIHQAGYIDTHLGESLAGSKTYLLVAGVEEDSVLVQDTVQESEAERSLAVAAVCLDGHLFLQVQHIRFWRHRPRPVQSSKTS
jgi:hypothetical protein